MQSFQVTQPAPSATGLQHNLAIILVSTIHTQGRREKPAETYNKGRVSLSHSSAGTDFIIFARTMTRGGQRSAGEKLTDEAGLRQFGLTLHLSPLLS